MRARWDIGTKFLYVATSILVVVALLLSGVVVYATRYLISADSIALDDWENYGAIFAVLLGIPITAASAFAAVKVAQLGYSITDTTERRERIREFREIADTSEQNFLILIDNLRDLMNLAESFVHNFETASKERMRTLMYSDQKYRKFASQDAYEKGLIAQAPGAYLGESAEALTRLIDEGVRASERIAKSLRRIYANKIGKRSLEEADEATAGHNQSLLARIGCQIRVEDPALRHLVSDQSTLSKIPMLCDEVDMVADRVRARGAEALFEQFCGYYVEVKRAIRERRTPKPSFSGEIGIDDFTQKDMDLLNLLVAGFLFYRNVSTETNAIGTVNIYHNLGAAFIADIWEIIPTPQQRRDALKEYAEGLDADAYQTFFASDPTIWDRMLPEEFDIRELAFRMGRSVESAKRDDVEFLAQACVRTVFRDFKQEFGRGVSRFKSVKRQEELSQLDKERQEADGARDIGE